MNEELERRVKERTEQLSNMIVTLEEEVSERMQAEKASKEQSDILDALFKSTTTPLVLLDRNFNFIRVSDSYARTCQKTVSEFEGHNYFEFYPHTENEAIFEEVVRTKKPYEAFAKPFVFPDHPEWGVSFWDWILYPLLDEKGEVEFLVFALEDVTERKRMGEIIKAERKRFEAVLEMMPAYAVLLTPDYHVAFANRVFRESFGEDKGRRCHEYLFGRSEPCETCETYTVLKTGKNHFWEWTGPNGRNYDIYDYPFTDSDGSPLIMEIGVDVTAHKKAENDLRSLSLYARGLIEASLDPMVTISSVGKITDVNKATEIATGQPRKDLIGRDFSSYFVEPQKAKEGYQKVLAEGLVRDFPLTIRHRSGRTMDVLYNAAIYKNELGKVQGVFAAARDVTEHKRMEKALWESEQRYRSLTEATTQIVWTTDADGQVEEDLPSWRAFTGQSVQEIKGWGWANALHPDDVERTKKIWSHSVKNRSIYDTEYRIKRYDGQYHYVSVRGVPVFEQDGSIREWVGTCTDITEQRTAEMRDNAANELLELFSQKTSRKDYLDSAVKVISEWSGCKCVGIRLLDEEGYISYASYAGFGDDFLALENNLCINRDNCVCIRVITGQADVPDRSLMTRRGSFCCENTFKFIEGLSEKEKLLFRGNCIRFGFASVAVVPVRYHGQIMGAIHLADKKEGLVDSSKVEFLETVALLIGEAVHRFNMEDELRQSEQRYRQLVELSPEGIGVEVDGRIVFINSAAVKLLGGQSADEFTGRQITDFIHPDFARIAQRQLKYLRRKGTALPLRESKFLRLDGTAFDVEVAATPLVYGQKDAAQIVFRDITSRKAVEKQILDNQEKLRSLTAQLVLTEERERRSVATELHDSLGPVLAFSKMELGSLQKVASPKTAIALKSIMASITEAIQQTRTLTFDLSPPALYTFGLEIAVGELADRFAEEHKLQVYFEKSDEDKPLTNYSKVLLYRCVRELMINIVKHSGAENVRISLTRDNNNIKIVVEDDGKGFNINGRDFGKGFGLFSIRERLTHIDGKIDIQSGEDRGTIVTLIAPLDINET